MLQLDAILLADCGPSAGLGHLRRTLVLADALRSKGCACRMLLTDPAGAAFVRDRGFSFQIWNRAAPLAQADIVVIDGYGFDAQLPRRWREATGAIVLIVDDTAERPLAAGAILNHNLYGADLDYRAYRADKFLLGPRYALIDPSFVELAGHPRPQPTRVVVSFGGTDDGKLAAAAASALLARDTALQIDIIVAPFAPLSAAASGVAVQFPGRCVVHRGAVMTEIMANAVLYVGAAGVTLMEAIAAGLDVVACAIADNQKINIEALTRLGYPAFPEFLPDAMAAAALQRLADRPTSVRPLIDGEGAGRVANVLCGLAEGRIGHRRQVGS